VTAKEYLLGLPRILFFTGKGGVGKTSVSCATSAALADRGKRVLLVSTDPASNLDEVLGLRLSSSPQIIPGIQGLSALNIDPAASAAAYREEVVGPYRDILPKASIASMEEQLSGACTVEIAAFNAFTKLLADQEATGAFDYVVFDTAPTGHTLRLLKLPAAWTSFIETNTTGVSCLGPLKGLQQQRGLYEASLRNLTDAAHTKVILVSRPERSTLLEAQRTSGELRELGVLNQMLVLNGVFTATDKRDSIARHLEERGRLAVSQIPGELSSLPRLTVPLLPYALVGIQNLRRMLAGEPRQAEPEPNCNDGSEVLEHLESLVSLVDEIEKAGPGVVMTMGKGGVGKTTIAAAIAMLLAQRGHPVHLTTTDPAAHLSGVVASGLPNLLVSRIDPEAETVKYSADIRAQSVPFLDADGQALLEEDLRSPCTEEIAVFRAFADVVAQGKNRFVVIDTAPTGHTILLLDAAESYHREVSRSAKQMPEAVRELLPRLRDPLFTHVILVALPEATPIHEAAKLQEDLGRAGIRPFAWVLNQSLYVNQISDPVLRARRDREIPYIVEVRKHLSQRSVVIPWRPEPVVESITIAPSEALEIVATPRRLS
jgi:arsenite-transporting ATPase